MDKQALLRLLRAHMPTLAKTFGVAELAVFGSVARGQEDEHSDIDLLVQFDGPATSARYFGLQFYLEDLTGKPVDLVTDKALRSELRPVVEREALSV